MQNLCKVLDRNLSAANTLLCGYFEGEVLNFLASFLPEAKIGVHSSYAQCLSLASKLASSHPQEVFLSFAKGFQSSDPLFKQLSAALSLCPLYRGSEALHPLYTLDQEGDKVTLESKESSDDAKKIAPSNNAESVEPTVEARIKSKPANSLLNLRELFLAVQPQRVLLVFPKSKEEFYLQLLELATVLASLQEEDFYASLEIFIVGDNDSGIKTLAKLVSPSLLLDNANRARLYRLAPTFTISDHLAKKVKAESYQLAGQEIFSLPGVFSSNRLDKGTELLLSTYQDLETAANRHLKTALTKIERGQTLHILDYACGAGVISNYLARKLGAEQAQSLQHYDLLDVQLPALLSAAYNLAPLASEQISFTLQALSSLAEGKELGANFARYQEIVSNPPFHSGQSEDLSIFKRLVVEGKELLAPQGRMRIVANSHLPYQVLLAEHFKTVEILAKDKGFTVYLASEPKRS